MSENPHSLKQFAADVSADHARLLRERDQLRQQVEKLLGAVENHRLFHVGGGLGAFHAAKRRSDEETREVEAQQDRNLWTAADQVRKELRE